MIPQKSGVAIYIYGVETLNLIQNINTNFFFYFKLKNKLV